MRFFRLFSKTTLTILLIFGQNVEENNTDQLKKTARQKLAPFSRYSSIKLAFLVKTAQNGKNEVQRSSNNSRTKNAMKNLIRYSESAENSLSPMFHQILPSSMSSGSNFYLKMANFDPKNMRFFTVFRDFQPNYLSYTNKIWHSDSPQTYQEAEEDRTLISVLVLGIFKVKNG